LGKNEKHNNKKKHFLRKFEKNEKGNKKNVQIIMVVRKKINTTK
jgi:hypothetical protein